MSIGTLAHSFDGALLIMSVVIFFDMVIGGAISSFLQFQLGRMHRSYTRRDFNFDCGLTYILILLGTFASNFLFITQQLKP
jgi:hypothetical protein